MPSLTMRLSSQRTTVMATPRTIFEAPLHLLAGRPWRGSGSLRPLILPEDDDAEDDQNPAQGVEVCEDVPLVAGEDVRAVQRADPVDDVERADDHQQGRREYDSTCTSHLVPPRL